MAANKSLSGSNRKVAVLQKPDIRVIGNDGQTIAIIEVRNRKDFTPEIVAEQAKYWLAHISMRHIPFFLLISQNDAYIWAHMKHREIKPVLPTYNIPMREVIDHYMPSLSPNERLRETELELIVYQWILQLSIGNKILPSTVSNGLTSSGFLDAVREASVQFEAAE
jgi:hypothetical protein